MDRDTLAANLFIQRSSHIRSNDSEGNIASVRDECYKLADIFLAAIKDSSLLGQAGLKELPTPFQPSTSEEPEQITTPVHTTGRMKK